ncbi:MT-A70-domain-containing protein [Hypoxylon crocopeplum]|nr:MT-A70-domain-containing protein [Hypoxylon crocopeplum]
MPTEADPQCQHGSCVLLESPDKSVVILDIPRSIEETQVLYGEPIERRIISSRPIETPWKIPEPKTRCLGQSTSPSTAIAELMTLERVKAALEEVKHSHKGPWCLPRICRSTESACNDKSLIKESRKRKKTSSDAEVVDTTPEPFIPVQSRYLLGTIDSQREAFLKDAPTFDLMVLDPPWPSRSVKRKRNYATAYGMRETRDLLTQIPVASHLKPDGLVAVWITNKTAIADLLTSPGGVFSEWGLEPVGEWIWLKITSSGDPVIDIEAQWRKPWERLLLGRKRGSIVQVPVPTKVIMGVPDLHSRKPNLRPLFESMLPENYSGLEVFARNLTAGWWSWGNEVLCFQHKHHWIELVDDEQESSIE